MSSTREFEVIVAGATGYTGRLCATYIARNYPQYLKWALCGRSLKKLEVVAQELEEFHFGLKVPTIILGEVENFVRRTRVVINCIGPYHLYFSPIVEACSKTGTHYVDATAEAPWVREMIQKNHTTAESTGAKIIHSTAMESAPADILSLALINLVRSKQGVNVNNIAVSLHEWRGACCSGGSMPTLLSMYQTWSPFGILKAFGPFSFMPPSASRRSIMSDIKDAFIISSVPGLGVVASSPSSMYDMAIAHRSSALMPQIYGQNFRLRAYVGVRNFLSGLIFLFATWTAMLALCIPPIHLLAKYIWHEPGQGPNRGDEKSCRIEYRAVAIMDKKKRPMAGGRLVYKGDCYEFTVLLMVEAAMALLKEDSKIYAGGGILTPAVLGGEYITRLQRARVFIETSMVEFSKS